MEIVPFADRHHDGVVSLWTSVFGYAQPRNDPVLSIRRKVEWGDGLFFVAVEGERVAGTIMAGYDGHRGWIYALAVRPDRRRHGVGTALLRQAEAALARLGCLKINLQIVETNGGVVSFYAANGYVVEPRISMGRTLEENLPSGPR